MPEDRLRIFDSQLLNRNVHDLISILHLMIDLLFVNVKIESIMTSHKVNNTV